MTEITHIYVTTLSSWCLKWRCSVFYAIGSEYLNITQINFMLEGIKIDMLSPCPSLDAADIPLRGYKSLHLQLSLQIHSCIPLQMPISSGHSAPRNTFRL